MAQKIEISQYKNYLEFREKAKTDLPNLMIYCSLDSYEFDILADHYREILKSKGEAFEVAIFVSEPGDLEKMFSEVFNLSMFSSLKLIIIKSGSDFFKPLLLAKGKALYDNFKRSIPELSEKVYLLIHYDDKDIPSKLLSMFQHKLGLLKNRNFYPNEKKAALESILKFEKITLDPAASDEFIHRIPPNTGSYLKNIQKLKLLLNKKEYTLEDIEEALFGNVDFNPFHITDLFFSGDKREFFRELAKLKKSEESMMNTLSLLNALLHRADELRKSKIAFTRIKDNDDKLFEVLGMSSYSDKRKYFMKNKLRKELSMFNDFILSFIYDSLIELNIRVKSSSNKADTQILMQEKFQKFFLLLRS